MRRQHSITVLATAAVLLLAIGPTEAQSYEDDGFLFEVYAGQIMPGPDPLDDETTYGVRAGFIAGTRLTILGSVGLAKYDGTVQRVDFDIDSLLLDVTASYLFMPNRKINLGLGGGIGGSISNGSTPRASALSEDSFTFNLTGDVVIHLSKLIYLKPEYRLRWHESRDDDETDSEITLALGFKF